MQYKEFLSIYDINYIKFKDGGKKRYQALHIFAGNDRIFAN